MYLCRERERERERDKMQPGASGRLSNLDRNAVEKNRRLQTKDLNSKLASLIPNQPSKEILPLRDMLEQATNYVVELKQNAEELKRRKVELEGDNKVGSQDERLPVLTIRDMDSILEVNLITGLNNNLKLHEVLSVLKEEGVEVESASYSSVGNQTFYTIHGKATNENLPPNVIKQLAKELKNLDETPPEGIKVGVNDDDFSIIYADIEGPAGTPYENGVFRMKLILSHDFPHSPPKGYFLTKIFHPNIATNGEICVVRCLLIEPFPESALNEQAGKMLLENYEEYARHARLYTGIHALKQKPRFKSGAISESTTALNVDQSNTSVLSVDEKKASSGAALPLPSPLASTTTFTKGGNGQDQPASALNSTTETRVSSDSVAAPPPIRSAISSTCLYFSLSKDLLFVLNAWIWAAL
ncbi:unnamed protein product [Camellia sinensis]